MKGAAASPAAEIMSGILTDMCLAFQDQLRPHLNPLPEREEDAKQPVRVSTSMVNERECDTEQTGNKIEQETAPSSQIRLNPRSPLLN
jgi:hypothetical protein